MKTLLANFFTHKDFLPPAESWPGTLFTPLQIGFCATAAAFIVFACIRCARKSEKKRKTVYLALWLIIYLIIHAAPYLPSYLASRKTGKALTA